ncbi:MAG: hypothetical protein GX856_03090 [Gammaproteobacteria bacterium]|nr:hypothetical protein [Gammaproteobacteria bacterium]
MTRPGRPDPLQPDERALADALATTAPAQGPDPALDAAILAAARADAAARSGAGTGPAPEAATVARATTGGTGSGRRRRRGPAWLRGGALAATLLLAVGVAWQLRPQFDARIAEPVPAQAPAAMAPAAAPAEPAPPGPTAPAGVVPETPPEPAARATPTAKAREATVTSAAPDALRRPPPAPPPPAPPAPPAPQGPAPAAPVAALQRQALPARAPVEVETDTGTGTDANADTDADAEQGTWFDQPLDETPPASVDAPDVREAWLGRIRELIAAERFDEARASFAEFQRRHPDAAVPDDLRQLLGGE